MKNVMNLIRRGFLTDRHALVAQRFAEAPQAVALAPSLWRVLYDLVVLEEELEAYEARRGWPQRSAKQVLRLLLTALQEADGAFLRLPDRSSGDAGDMIAYLTGDDANAEAEVITALAVPRTQARLLLILRAESGRVVTRDQVMRRLYAQAREADIPDEKIVDVFICKLRAALKRAGAPEHIETVWGTGWRHVGAAARNEAAE